MYAFLFAVITFLVIAGGLSLFFFAIGLSEVLLDEACKWYGDKTPRYLATLALFLLVCAFLTWRVVAPGPPTASTEVIAVHP